MAALSMALKGSNQCNGDKTMTEQRVHELLQKLTNPLDVQDAFELLKKEEAPLWMLRMVSHRYRELIKQINAPREAA